MHRRMSREAFQNQHIPKLNEDSEFRAQHRQVTCFCYSQFILKNSAHPMGQEEGRNMLILNCGQRTHMGLRDADLPTLFSHATVTRQGKFGMRTGNSDLIPDQAMQSLPGSACGKEPGRLDRAKNVC